MICLVMLGNGSNVSALIEAAAVERNRKSLQAAGSYVRRIVNDRGGVDAAAQPDSDRHIRYQMLADGIPQQAIQFVFGIFQGSVPDFSWGLPIGVRSGLAIRPFHHMTGSKLQIGRAHVWNSSHPSISYAVFCLKKKTCE